MCLFIYIFLYCLICGLFEGTVSTLNYIDTLEL